MYARMSHPRAALALVVEPVGPAAAAARVATTSPAGCPCERRDTDNQSCDVAGLE